MCRISSFKHVLLNSKLHLSVATLAESLAAGVKIFNFIHFVSRISRIHENYMQRDEFINFSKSIFKTKWILENSGENTSCPCKQISWIAKKEKQISWIAKREKQISWITKNWKTDTKIEKQISWITKKGNLPRTPRNKKKNIVFHVREKINCF